MTASNSHHIDTDADKSIRIPLAVRRFDVEALHEVGGGSFFRPSHARALGLGSRELAELIKYGYIERIARGLYRISDAEPTEHYTLAAVCALVPDAIVCLLSALWVHELGTQLPREAWIAIDHKAREPRILEFPTRIVRYTGIYRRYGVVDIEFEGVPARITNVARTVVDCFRFRRIVGRDVAIEALRDALSDRKASVDEIWRAAEVCRAKSLVGPVLEAVLA